MGKLFRTMTDGNYYLVEEEERRLLIVVLCEAEKIESNPGDQDVHGFINCT